MSHYTWVCFECRMTVRRHGTAKSVRCSLCGKSCECLGYKIPVPSRTKVKLWQKLKIWLYDSRRSYYFNQQQKTVRTIHNLEKAVVKLELQPENKARRDYINRLKRRLEELQE